MGGGGVHAGQCSQLRILPNWGGHLVPANALLSFTTPTATWTSPFLFLRLRLLYNHIHAHSPFTLLPPTFTPTISSSSSSSSPHSQSLANNRDGSWRKWRLPWLPQQAPSPNLWYIPILHTYSYIITISCTNA